nr:hypothetical protein [Shouchella shacheensis]
MVEREGAATYRICSAKENLHGHPYRFLVVQSDQMDARKEKTIQSQLEKEWQRYATIKTNWRTKILPAKPMQRPLLPFFSSNRKGSHTFEGTVICEERPGKRLKRGRPKKGEVPPPPVPIYRVQLELHRPSEEEVEQLANKHPSLFLSPMRGTTPAT